MDVKSAFVNGDMMEYVYVELPCFEISDHQAL